MNSGENRKSFWDQFTPRRARVAHRYSRFVRGARILLPLVAAGVVGLLLAWPRLQPTVEAIPREAVLPQEPQVGRNELLNPRFESRDDKDQPFTVTAARAIQSETDPQLVLLDKPMADIALKDGAWLAAQADKGSYRREEEKLLLEGAVKLFHNDGYELKTEKMLVHIGTREAWSDDPVHAQGPAGTIDATGLTANGVTGKLIFTGPAKLVLNRAVKGL
jgi:lipopolysaccharide export system protein LptC